MPSNRLLPVFVLYWLVPLSSGWCQPAIPTIDNYSPKSMLKVSNTNMSRARFPVIDIHGHFGRRLNGDRAVLSDYVQIMDRNNIALSVSLDAVLGDEESHFEFLQPDSDRFIVFAHIDFVGTAKDTDSKHHACNQPDFVHKTVLLLEDAKKKGVVGLKFFKNFGLDLRNPDGSLIRIDDVRFDPIWQKCGQLNLPVLIHTADPAAFFEPLDSQNERYEELLRHPDWSFHGPGFPSREELLTARNRVIARHPQTLFIGAHVANSAEDLATVSQWLDSYPNLYVEIASRIGELGRQPYTARKFVLKYQDRILFGTDGPWPESRLAYYWRFLETWDEYFPYSEKRPPPQGLWHIYGLGLPAEVLKKIYFENALNILPAIKEKYRRVTIDSPVDG